MYVSNVVIKNFRNFKSTSFDLPPRAVIVGENSIGKSNFLHALRLVLDPSLPDSERRLGEDDFNSKIKFRDQIIEIQVRLRGFEQDSKEYSLLCECLELVQPEPVALLKYIYRRKASIKLELATDVNTFQWSIVGPRKQDKNGNFVEKPISQKVRQLIELTYLGALRDVAHDLSSWRRSPLRPLIDQLSVERDVLEKVVQDIREAADPIVKHPRIQQLGSDIASTLLNMIGAEYGFAPHFDVNATSSDRLLRLLTLLTEDGRDMEQLSTGLASVLYVVLWLARAEREKKQFGRNQAQDEPASRILTIEEPEAHLHPHLQRLLFRSLFSAPQPNNERTQVPIIVTTHSPHILSIAPLRSILRLYRHDGDVVAASGQRLLGTLDPQDRDAVQRYMDVTRNEMLFAKRIIFVEGTSEQFIVSRFAELLFQDSTGSHDPRILDKHGVTVCAVQSTNFEPFIRIMGPEGFAVPFVVITDGDPVEKDGSGVTYAGISRAVRLSKWIDSTIYGDLSSLEKSSSWEAVRNELAKIGIFVGEQTLEADLWAAGAQEQMIGILRFMGLSEALEKRLRDEMQSNDLPELEKTKRLVNRIEYLGGKGWLAQLLVPELNDSHIPKYILGALRYLEKDWRRPPDDVL